MKKKVIIIVAISILILLATNLLSIASLKAEITGSTIDIKGGQEVTVTLKFNEYKEIKNGLNAYKATLEYNRDIFEDITQENFICQNNWEKLKYNGNTGEFVAIKKAKNNIPEEVVKITLRAKTNVKANVTDIKIKDIVASEGEKDIKVEDVKLTINVIEEQEEKTEKITSSKYNIEQGYITRVLPNTTVGQFKQNVTLENVNTEPKMIFTKDGTELEENSKITTGTKVKVGNTLQYTIVVIGDTDGDSDITVNDLAELKLHLIEIKMLDNIKLKAADIDNDNEITVNDLAQMKLILINLFELK